MTYYLYRGEAQKAVPHRERAEALALRGGTSWSAMSQVTIRMVQGCTSTGDVVGLVHVVADLARIATLSPSVQAIYELAKGHLELLRGHPDRALAIYERTFATQAAVMLPSYPIERGMHVQALCALGDFQAARTVALKLIEEVEASGRDGDYIMLVSRVGLARAEAGLGNFARALELIDSCFERASRYGNPLAIGSVHRERAQVAVLAGDPESFVTSLAAMTEQFAATENPWLIQQCDVVRAAGKRLGIVGSDGRLARPADELDGATAIEIGIEQPAPHDGVSGTRARAGSGGE
jgi:tetratricopeptide (TPR) repeat protein